MKCFIISPIGQPGTPTRNHADDVYECVIAPALAESNIEGRRADHIKDVGRITLQMYDDILYSDFCIALLHGFNPNVFYELAVAHSAGIPVILLSEKGTDPPFDIKDERVFHYDLTPRPIYRGENVKSLLVMIDSVRRLQGKREVPFGTNLTPLAATAANTPYVLRNETNATADYWRQLVGRTRTRLYLAGIGFTGWRGMQNMKEELAASAAAGCDIRIMTIDEDNPALACMMNPEISTTGVAGQNRRFAEARTWFKSAVADGRNAQVRALRHGMLYQQIIIADDRAYISPYLYTANTGFSPSVEISQTCPAFGAFLHEFDQLWKLNKPASGPRASTASSSVRKADTAPRRRGRSSP